MRRPEQRNLTYSSVRQPKWNSPDHSSIDCLVVFDHISGEHPFTATPYDSEPHGRELFQRIVAGEFGQISPHELIAIDAETQQQAAAAFANFASTPAGVEFLAEIAEHNEEIESRSSRALAALAESHLSKRLSRLLQIAGVPDSKIEHMKFSVKIKEAEARGNISRTEAVAIALIGKIRNEVTHKTGNFYTLKILKLTQDLYACLASYMSYKPVSSLADQWIDLIFIDAFGLVNHSLKARADPKIQARIVS